uniref:Uncharacterized protein n=1 Tax=Fagus sylvatica TaxID=28930 RepID=A0A2N9G218_FAGSY
MGSPAHRLTLSFSLLHSQLSPSLSSSRSCSGAASLSAFAWGRTRRHGVKPTSTSSSVAHHRCQQNQISKTRPGTAPPPQAEIGGAKTQAETEIVEHSHPRLRSAQTQAQVETHATAPPGRDPRRAPPGRDPRCCPSTARLDRPTDPPVGFDENKSTEKRKKKGRKRKKS